MPLFPSTSQRLTRLLETAPVIEFDNQDRFIFFSDSHRGDGTWKDDYVKNRNLHLHALTHYHRLGFTYIELGDGDELFEVPNFDDIRYTHSHIFHKLRDFYTDGRLQLIYGNHDIVRCQPRIVAQQLHSYYDVYEDRQVPLFPEIQVHEALALLHRPTGRRIFLFHGHQGDLFNDHLWRLARFLVRHIWSRLQFMGWRDPTLPPKPYKRVGEIERRISAWAAAQQQMVICGHTHRSWFSRPGEIPYFNCGSCIHPRCITGLEIQEGTITLIKWALEPQQDVVTGDGMLYIRRSQLAGGPVPLEAVIRPGGPI